MLIEAHFETPVGFVHAGVLAYFYMLREIELSTPIYSSVFFCMIKLQVTIRLSASKTDPEALSVARTWGCVRPEGEGRDAHNCPFHVAL